MKIPSISDERQDGPLSTEDRKHFLMNNLLEVGLKLILVVFPFAVAWASWVTAEVFVGKNVDEDVQELKTKQSVIITDVAHIPVVDERLRFISEQLGEIKADVRELKSRP
jgi:hypothetical protein